MNVVVVWNCEEKLRIAPFHLLMENRVPYVWPLRPNVLRMYPQYDAKASHYTFLCGDPSPEIGVFTF